MIKVANEIQNLINRGALFVINHSGGKDSQAMTAILTKIVPVNQLHVVHAHLPGVEWDGTRAHVENTIADYNLPLTVVRARKTFIEMALHRKMWPSPSYRQCTSDLKRGPIEKAIRHEVKKRDNLLVVNCMGMRAQESSGRSKLSPFKHNARNSKAGREWYDWLPIHGLKEDEVFSIIRAEGQEAHWAYSKGMSRLSCCFCIMASGKDLKIAAEHNPTLFEKIVKIEKEIGQALLMPSKAHGRRFLDEVVGVTV